MIARSLQSFGYKRSSANPYLTGPVLAEAPLRPPLSEIEGPIDIGDVFRRSEKVPPVDEDTAAAGSS